MLPTEYTEDTERKPRAVVGCDDGGGVAQGGRAVAGEGDV